MHYWAEANVLGTVRAHDLLLDHGECRQSIWVVTDDADEVLPMRRGTMLGDDTLGGLTAKVLRSEVGEWLDVDIPHAGMMKAVDGCSEEASTTAPPLVNTDEH